VQFAGSVANKFGDGFGDLELFLGVVGRDIPGAGFASSMIRAIMETASMGYFSGSGFGGEHDGVGTVEDRIGHVGGFGARGAGILGHGFEHLGAVMTGRRNSRRVR